MALNIMNLINISNLLRTKLLNKLVRSLTEDVSKHTKIFYNTPYPVYMKTSYYKIVRKVMHTRI